MDPTIDPHQSDPVQRAGAHPSHAARSFVAQMTVEEKVSLLSGSDVWRTAPIERLDIPAVKVSDGPNGVRGDSTSGARAVCLPAPIGMAATFDAELVTELGRLLGRETVRKGAHILLAPTINMARHPLGGRNFESFGEDPLLTSEMAVAYIRGVQDEGVGACAKHFVANDVEEARLTVSSEVDAQTLREVYLAPFEAAVDAGVWSIMAAYPKLNGEHCTENRWLLTTLLREEWGFDGLVMSDWGATHHPTRSVAAGLDLEMPGPPRALGPKLVAAVEAGDLSMAVLDERAATMVDLSLRADLLGTTEDPERSVDLPEERQLVRRAAADGMVLLTNRAPNWRGPGIGTGDTAESAAGPLLPLPRDLPSLAVIGPNAEVGVIQGGGSAQLTSHDAISPIQGLRAALPDAAVSLDVGCLAHRYVPQVAADSWVMPAAGTAPLTVEIFDNPVLEGAPAVTRAGRRLSAFYQGGNNHVPRADVWSQRWTGRLAIEQSGLHRFGVLSVGRARVIVDGELVADNWTDPQPGHAFFERASEEVVGAVELRAGAEVEVVVEWSSGEDEQLAGLRFGVLPPVDEDGLMEQAVTAAGAADVAVVVVGLSAEWETESHDRVMFGLPGRQDELIRRVVEANPRTVVAVNAGAPIDMPWLDEVPATLVVWYPGQEFGAALADVLLGRCDPGGRLPVTFPRTLEQTPTHGSVPGDGKFLYYEEGLFIGHRWYREHGVDPRLAFGHGLSFTEFEIGEPVRLPAGGGDDGPVSQSVTVSVTNTGRSAGKCVIQAYLDPQIEGRPRVLAAFRALNLNPGQRRDIVLEPDRSALRCWNPEQDRWEWLAGSHRLEIGTSATDIAHVVDL